MPVQQLTELIRFVRRNSPFYRELYAGLPDHVDELTALPVVPQDAFWRANTPRDNRLLTGPLDEAVVFKSGGTTGSPKFSVYTREEWREFTSAFGGGLVEAGLRPGHRVADLFYAGELYASFTFILDSLHRAPVANVRLPIGGAAPLESTVHTLEEFDVDVVAGTTTTLCTLADHLVRAGRQLPGVRILFFGGEGLYEDQRPLLRRAFPRAQARSIGYAGVDSGLLGQAVPGADPRVHRAFTPHTVVEILDENTGEPLTREGVAGRVVVTDLRRRLMPVIRYPVGDRAEWTDADAGHFRILGRAEEGVRIGAVSLYTQDVHDLVRAADPTGLVIGIQLVVRRWEGRDGLVLRLAVDGDPAGGDAEQAGLGHLAGAVAKEILAARQMYAEEVEAARIHPLAVEWVRHGELVVNPRTGKLKRVIDERPHS
ncbi:phenylacetate--CoA ligase family protein [Streptomyces sp. GS7]|uniref:phenylacetate--CoA ligase family protein n=1 Tax=Streptomyces sp. GS7 TaxID=2692234 RepID=UPI00131785F7|nr:phenylacetate--CoA ligase family protein [Streptomyces sp. GS7]QHC22240.1 phenylacetate--CoA ligase family protein [Streptomyces sp. GS7]